MQCMQKIKFCTGVLFREATAGALELSAVIEKDSEFHILDFVLKSAFYS